MNPQALFRRTLWVVPLLGLGSCSHPETRPSGATPPSGMSGAFNLGAAPNVGSGGSSSGGSPGTVNRGGSESLGGSSAGAPSAGSSAVMESARGGSASTGGGGGAAFAGGGSAGSPEPAPIVGPPYRFPQNLRTAYCTYPAAASEAPARAAFERWKTELVTSDGAGGFRRVRRPNNENDTTVSEGIGYGMILAVVMDDQSLFDDLWKYSQQYLNDNGLMNWEIGADGQVTGQGHGAATDADEDMAWALALADKKWSGGGSLGDSYLNLAKSQIDRIWNHEVDHSRGELLVAGDSWGPTVAYNPSYFAPNEYRLFGKLTNKTDVWNKVIDKGYSVLASSLSDASGNAANGLVPAWTNDSGSPSAAWAGGPTNYQYDAARVPFRIGLDYCDFGEPRAKAYLAKTSAFFAGVGASNIVDGYDLNGTPHPENAGMQSALFVGAAGVGAMSDASFQAFLDDTYALLTTKDMLPPSYYFNLSWEVFSLTMMSGNLFDYTLHP